MSESWSPSRHGRIAVLTFTRPPRSWIDAAEAHRIGLLNAVLPTDGFLDAALGWCERMARHPAPALFAAVPRPTEGRA